MPQASGAHPRINRGSVSPLGGPRHFPLWPRPRAARLPLGHLPEWRHLECAGSRVRWDNYVNGYFAEGNLRVEIWESHTGVIWPSLDAAHLPQRWCRLPKKHDLQPVKSLNFLSPSPVPVEIDCTLPPKPTHGDHFLVYGPNDVLIALQYLCYQPYELTGSSQRACLPNNTWSGTPPLCTQGQTISLL